MPQATFFNLPNDKCICQLKTIPYFNPPYETDYITSNSSLQ
jgi:hypothetical protein